jgi:DNA-directed RNA polymerase subunit H
LVQENDAPFKTIEHRLIPKHEVLGEKETSELFNNYKINERKLPRIFNTDPIAKGLDAKVGDIVRINRESETAGGSLYYRVVVKGMQK